MAPTTPKVRRARDEGPPRSRRRASCVRVREAGGREVARGRVELGVLVAEGAEGGEAQDEELGGVEAPAGVGVARGAIADERVFGERVAGGLQGFEGDPLVDLELARELLGHGHAEDDRALGDEVQVVGDLAVADLGRNSGGSLSLHLCELSDEHVSQGKGPLSSRELETRDELSS